MPPDTRPGPPLWLLAELTYRCPLHCVFCYNPVDFARQEDELSTDDWIRVLREGRELGAVQCGFSGGEPLVRDDLEVLVAEARQLGYYTNLLTSGCRPDGATRAGAQGRRARPRAAVVPGFHARDERLSVAHQDLRAEEPGRAADQGPGLADGDERGDPPHEHRSHRPHHRHGPRTRRRVLGARQYAVLLVGVPQPRAPAAHARTAAARRSHHRRLARKARRQDAPVLRRARLARGPAQALLQRLGQHVPERRARRRRPALPHRAHAARPELPQRARRVPARDLVRLRRLQPLPRHGLDEGALHELQAPRARSRRLPLPGLYAGW